MLDDKHIAVEGCTPFRIAAPYADAVDAADDAPLRIAIAKQDVGMALYVARLIVVAV